MSRAVKDRLLKSLELVIEILGIAIVLIPLLRKKRK